MRFKSKKVDGYQVFAVSGTNTVSFGIDFDSTKTKGLLGFGVTRKDPGKEKPYDMYGFKVFPSIVPKPDEKTSVRTSQHPIQSFVWDDFTAQPDETYEYAFHPLKGTPKNLDRRAIPIPIKVRTEKLFSNLEHDIFFNRGVASSQAYVRKFGNKKPDQLSPAKRKEAEEWLSRKLDDAMLVFIKAAKKGDTLLCCFYEFRYEPAAQELKNALSRGVKLRLIVDAKVNKRKDKKTGKMIESFPREENLRMLKEVSMPSSVVILRQNKPSNIQHNKFMVLLKGRSSVPTEVWTGSTNLSVGGIHGQTNVGHWVRNKKIAVQFRDYWNLLSADPGPKKGDDRATALKKNNAWRSSVEKKLDKAPTSLKSVPKGVTTIFSPRSGMAVLNMYAQMVDDADDVSCITLAFGISEEFKKLLSNNTAKSHIAFFLLEKEDKPNKRSKKRFVALTAKNNVYKAWGSYLKDPVYQWAKETNAKALQLNQHVSYIHSKFLLKDPLSTDPIVVTGSANFSKASTNDNDENMLVIRGDKRVADIYFTEFNRLFFHYYFRSIQEKNRTLSAAEKKKRNARSLQLDEDDRWLKNYKPGSLKNKRVNIFKKMAGFVGA